MFSLKEFLNKNKQSIHYITAGASGHILMNPNYVVKIIPILKDEVLNNNHPAIVEIRMLQMLKEFPVIQILDYKLMCLDEFLSMNFTQEKFLLLKKLRNNFQDICVIIFLEKADKTLIDENIDNYVLRNVLVLLCEIQHKYPSFKHNDFKANNILIKDGKLLLCDFDFACSERIINSKVESEWVKEYGINSDYDPTFDFKFFIKTLSQFFNNIYDKDTKDFMEFSLNSSDTPLQLLNHSYFNKLRDEEFHSVDNILDTNDQFQVELPIYNQTNKFILLNYPLFAKIPDKVLYLDKNSNVNIIPNDITHLIIDDYKYPLLDLPNSIVSVSMNNYHYEIELPLSCYLVTIDGSEPKSLEDIIKYDDLYAYLKDYKHIIVNNNKRIGKYCAGIPIINKPSMDRSIYLKIRDSQKLNDDELNHDRLMLYLLEFADNETILEYKNKIITYYKHIKLLPKNHFLINEIIIRKTDNPIDVFLYLGSASMKDVEFLLRLDLDSETRVVLNKLKFKLDLEELQKSAYYLGLPAFIDYTKFNPEKEIYAIKYDKNIEIINAKLRDMPKDVFLLVLELKPHEIKYILNFKVNTIEDLYLLRLEIISKAIIEPKYVSDEDAIREIINKQYTKGDGKIKTSELAISIGSLLEKEPEINLEVIVSRVMLSLGFKKRRYKDGNYWINISKM